MSAKFRPGGNIAMKVPAHQYEATLAFYRDTVGLEPDESHAPAMGFRFGSFTLWIDRSEAMSQAEIWLELFTDDFASGARHLAEAGVPRCDPIEPLGEGFDGGWITSPAQIVHMVRTPDAW